MVKVKITAGIIDEVVQRELHTWHEDPRNDRATYVYKKIWDAPVTRKDGSITIEVTDAELKELYSEADYSGDPQGACDPSAGYIKAWAALKRQIRKLNQ